MWGGRLGKLMGNISLNFPSLINIFREGTCIVSYVRCFIDSYVCFVSTY